MQALTAPPSAICIADMLDAGINKSQPTMFVNIGLQNGVLLRTVLDPVSGHVTDTRTRYGGGYPILILGDWNVPQIPRNTPCQAHPCTNRAPACYSCA